MSVWHFHFVFINFLFSQLIALKKTTHSAATSGSKRASLFWAPSLRGPPNSAPKQCLTRSTVRHLHHSPASLRGLFHCIVISSQPTFLLSIYAADANLKLMHTFSYVTTVQSTS